MADMQDEYEKKLDESNGQILMMDKVSENLNQRIEFLEQQICQHNGKWPDYEINMDAEFAFNFLDTSVKYKNACEQNTTEVTLAQGKYSHKTS